MLAFNGPEVADSAADVCAGIFGNFGRELPFSSHWKTAVPKRFDRRSDRVMNKGAHLARLFFGNEFQWIKVFDFAREFDRELFGVELPDIVGAAAPAHQRGPRVFDRIANRCDEAKPRNHDATCQVKAPWKGSDN